MTKGLYGLTTGGQEVWPVVVVAEGSMPVRGEAAHAILLQVLVSMAASISGSAGWCGL